MVNTISPERGLTESLAERARHTPERLLLALAAAGLASAIGIGLWRGSAWELLLGIATCCLAFGVWGIADRQSRRMEGRAGPVLVSLAAVRLIAAALGFAAAAFVMLALLARPLGHMIS